MVCHEYQNYNNILCIIMSNIYFPNIRIIFPHMYESKQLAHDLALHYRDKIVKWINDGSFDNLLKYIVIKDNRASVVENNDEYDKNKHISGDKQKKIKYFVSTFLTQEAMSSLIDKIKFETGLQIHEFNANKKLVKLCINDAFKRQFKKYMNEKH